MTLTIPIVLAILTTVLLIAYFAYQLANRKKPMTKSKEALTKRELEQQLERTQRELQQAKNDAISKDNYAKAEVRKKELDVEAAEWVKAQPKYYVLVTKLNGKKVKTEEFVAKADVRIYSPNDYQSYSRERGVRDSLTYEVEVSKNDARVLAEQFILESKGGVSYNSRVGAFVSNANATVIGDLTILNHAIESFEIIEVKAKK